MSEAAALSRKWVPSFYVDEVTPKPRPSPSDWIEEIKPGLFVLAAAFDDEDADHRPLNEGEIIQFDWIEVLGRAEMTVTEDGYTLDSPEPPCPPGACITCWEPGDSDTVSDGPAMIADNLSLGDEVTIEWYCWCNLSTPHVFQGGKFVEKASTI